MASNYWIFLNGPQSDDEFIALVRNVLEPSFEQHGTTLPTRFAREDLIIEAGVMPTAFRDLPDDHHHLDFDKFPYTIEIRRSVDSGERMAQQLYDELAEQPDLSLQLVFDFQSKLRWNTYTDSVVQDDDVCGGQPRIRGTRITVANLVDDVGSGMTPDEVLDSLGHPSLTTDDIAAALAYRDAHPDTYRRGTYDDASQDDDS